MGVIVDDESSYLDRLEPVLPAVLRCPVRTFTCPLAALGAWVQLDLCFLVTDYDMPQLNGLDLFLSGAPLGSRGTVRDGDRTADAADGG